MTRAGSSRSRTLRGELLAALAACGFGSAYVATAFALRSFGPVPVAFWRGLLATIVLWAVIAVRARRGRAAGAAHVGDDDPRIAGGRAAPEFEGQALRDRLLRLGVISILGGPLFLSAMNLAVAHVGATIASFVAGLYAILAALFGPALLHEHLRRRVVLAFVVALVGTALLAQLDPRTTDIAGLGWGLAAAIVYALYLVLGRRWSAPNHLDALTIAACATSATAVALGVPLLLTAPDTVFPAVIVPEAAVAIGWLAVVVGLGTILVMASVRLIPAARSAAFLLLNPITATVLSVVLLGLRPTPLQMLGGLLVLLGIAAATLPGASAPAADGPGPIAEPVSRSAG